MTLFLCGICFFAGAFFGVVMMAIIEVDKIEEIQGRKKEE